MIIKKVSDGWIQTNESFQTQAVSVLLTELTAAVGWRVLSGMKTATVATD